MHTEYNSKRYEEINNKATELAEEIFPLLFGEYKFDIHEDEKSMAIYSCCFHAVKTICSCILFEISFSYSEQHFYIKRLFESFGAFFTDPKASLTNEEFEDIFIQKTKQHKLSIHGGSCVLMSQPKAN